MAKHKLVEVKSGNGTLLIRKSEYLENKDKYELAEVEAKEDKTELDKLKARADELGIKYGSTIGAETLSKKIAEVEAKEDK